MNLPGWNSLPTVTRIHDVLEITGFVLLGILAIVEAFQFFYGNRKDMLTEQIHRTESTEAQGKITALQAEEAPRHLTSEQQQTLIAVLSPFRSQKVSIISAVGSPDAKPYAEDFVQVLVAAQWDLGPNPGIEQRLYDHDPVGVLPTISKSDVGSNGALTPAFLTLGEILFDLKILRRKAVFEDGRIPSGHIEIVIGQKD